MNIRQTLAAHIPTGTAEYTLDLIPVFAGAPGHAALIVRPSGEANAKYRSAMAKASNDPRLRGHGRRRTPAMTNASREVEAELYAKHVVVGWRNVFEDGAEVPFSETKCLELLMALVEPQPDGATPFAEEFEYLMAFCRNNDNFRDTPLAEAGALGKG